MRRLILTTAFAAAIALPALAQTAAAPTVPATAAPAPGAPSTAPAGPDMGHHGAAMMQKFKQKFDAANTTHDGHLTLAQAKAAKLNMVVQNFATMDSANRGYVTFNTVVAYVLDKKADQLHAQAQQLRAGGQ